MHHRLSLLLFVATVMSLSANDIPLPEKDIWPESPQTKAIRQVMMPMPSIVTGACEMSIPIYTIDVEDFEIPISLQYRSNGIKPEDDTQTIGYGWVITPPLRITRQILGRPDELFKFVGDEGCGFLEDGDYVKGYRCVTSTGIETRSFHSDIYDSMHDIFTIYLINKTLTMFYKDGNLYGIDCDEYKIECGPLLSYIKVTDPTGIIYNFSIAGEYIEVASMQTEWMLSSITLQSGTVIDIGWEVWNNNRFGFILSPPRTIYYNTDDYFREQPIGDYSKKHQYYSSMILKSISFPGGLLECKYKSATHTTGQALEKIRVTSENNEVFKATLTHDNSQTLLTGINIGGDKQYTFEYNSQKFADGGSVDWWGFYNGAGNGNSITPKVITGSEIGTHTISGVTRSVNESMMQANILIKAIFPTGGSVEWEYETHRFAPQSAPLWTDYYLNNEPTLSKGGGLRVKKIIMKKCADDASPRIKTYIYGKNGNGLAQIEAVPFLHTFISEFGLIMYRRSLYRNILTTDRYLTVNRFSDYLEGQPGLTPIWYDFVTETDSEGKTEYTFDYLCPRNDADRDWGYVLPTEINTAFSKGPQLIEKTSYKIDPSGNYKAVEKTEWQYDLISHPQYDCLYNFSVRRNCIFLETDYSPDFGPPYENYLAPVRNPAEFPNNDGQNAIVVYRDDYYWFESTDCYIYPLTEKLMSKKTTEFFDNGETTVVEKYQYVPQTEILSKTVLSSQNDSITTEYCYTDTFSTAIKNAMKSRNICGIPLCVKQTFRGESTEYSMEMAQFGTTFRPKRVWQKRGNSKKWSLADYDYNNSGNLIKKTTNDGIINIWTWDNYSHPLTMSVNSTLTSHATWNHLVGVTSLTSPAGSTQSFTYDNCGRLSSMSLNSRKMEAYSYNINQTGENNIRTIKYVTPDIINMRWAKFDGLGRNHINMQSLSGDYVATLTEFDVMSRPVRQWMPANVSYSSTDEEIKEAAKVFHNDNHPYLSTSYEASQRNLQLETMKAGDDWHNGNKYTTIKHVVNDLSNYRCTKFDVSPTGIVSNGIYPKGELTVEVVTDEDGMTTETYTDFRGLTICRKQSGLATYWIYNNFGQPVYIIPPAISDKNPTSNDIQEFCYSYTYDSRGRLASKKFPGAKTAYYLYDDADRLVAEKSAHHAAGQWRLYCYDNAGRQVLAVDCAISDSQASEFASTCRTATPSSAGIKGYTVTGGLPESATVVRAIYYDDYQFIVNNSLGEYFYFIPNEITAEDCSGTGGSAGLMTGIYTGDGFEAYYYNKDGKIIQQHSTGFNSGHHDLAYRYDGQIATSRTTHNDSRFRNHLRHFSYDNNGRLTSTAITQSTTGGSQIATATTSGTYNSIGQVDGVSLGSAMRSFNYTVNGWFKSSTTQVADGSTLSETLFYADAPGACYNGNIAAKEWNNGRYDYTYDNYNRLIEASFSEGKPNQDFSTAYSYDKNSNITNIVRRGIVDKAGTNETYGTLDDIDISYSGNRVSEVNALTEALPFEGMTGLGINNNAAPLAYDDSGRICQDATRGIASIEYNNDGRPVKIVFNNGNEQHDCWDGFNNHLSTTFYTHDASGELTEISTRQYFGDGHILVDGNSVYEYFPGGYFHDGEAYYYITDYQGNTTSVVDSRGNIVQSADYYPYGEPWREPSGQPFLYGGKERLRVYGLNEYDFKARRLIPALGIFAVFDDAAEKNPGISPYLYCSGNPINRIDPTGMTDYEVDGENKNIPDGHDNRFMTVTLEEYEKLLYTYNNGTYEAVFKDIAKIVGYVDRSMFLDDESTTGYGYEFEFLKVPTKNGTHSTLDNFETTVSAYEIGNGAKTELFEMASRDALKGTPNQSLKGTQAVRAAMGKEVGAYFRIAKGIGYAGCIVTGINSINTIRNCNFNDISGYIITAKAMLDLGVSAYGACGGPLGLFVSSLYFIADGATDGFGINNYINSSNHQ